MSVDFTINQGDTLPILLTNLTYSDGSPVNLTGASVKFVMRALSSTTPSINAAAAIVTPLSGAVSYTFSAADSSAPGLFMGGYTVAFSGGQIMTFPTTGYLSIEIQPNLVAAGIQELVSVDDVKDVLNFTANDRVHDTKILRWIKAVRPVIEAITGPIIPRIYDEWYDGGQYWIMLRHPPSTGYGTDPICTINFCETYIGPIEYQFTGVGNPVNGSIYTYEVDTFSRVVRRGPGGGIIPFPNLLQSVHIGYLAGQSSVPDNVYEGTLELLRINYQRTAQSTNQGWGGGGVVDEEIVAPPTGFFMPNRVRELISPTKRAPSVF